MDSTLVCIHLIIFFFRDIKSRDQDSVSRPLETTFSWSRSRSRGSRSRSRSRGVRSRSRSRSRGSYSRSRQIWSRLETEISSKQCTSKKCRPTRHRPTASKQQQGCCRHKFLIFNPYHIVNLAQSDSDWL